MIHTTIDHPQHEARQPGGVSGSVWLFVYLAVGMTVVLVQPATGPVLWYPPLAIGMALLARHGSRWVLGVLACELAIATTQYGGVLGLGAIIACAASVECLVGAMVLRAALPAGRIAAASDYLKVLIGCGIVVPFGLVFVGTGVIHAIYPDTPFTSLLQRWWVGDATGVIVLLPVILLWQQRDVGGTPQSVGTRTELVLLSICTAAMTAWVFVSPIAFDGLAFYGQRVVCVLPLIWAAVRFPPRVAALVILLTQVTAVAITWIVIPTIGGVLPVDWLVGIHVFMVVTAVGGLGLAFAIEGERTATMAARVATAREAAASARLEFLMTAAPSAIYSCQAQPPYATEFMSGGSGRLFGYADHEFTSDPTLWIDGLHPEDQHILADLPALIASGRGVQEYRFRHKDGAYRWIRNEIAVVEHQGRRVLVGHCIDVTKVKHTERVVRESESRFQAFMANSPVAAWITDHEGRMLYASPGYEKMFPTGDPTGKRLEEMYPPEIAAEYRRNNEEVLRERKVIEVVESGLRADGSAGRFLVYKFPINADVTGSTMAVGGVAVDITERERTAAALRQAERMAQAASIAKSEFLANMSHELRTPLTAILGFAELLRDESDNPAERRDNLDTITRNGQHLLAIINDILDLSKIEAGRLEIERLTVEPAKLVQEVLELLRVRTLGKRLVLTCRVDNTVPREIVSDPVRLRQILMNLVGNAIKFTDEGEVGVRVCSRDQRLWLEVHDTGMGMSPEQMLRLFKPFEQGDASMSRVFGGTGLGLRISQRLAHMLGGTIGVDSAPGRGSIFTASIPFDAAPPTTPTDHQQARPSFDLRGASVLLVEDGADNQRLLDHLLTRAGARVTLASNGVEGLAAAGLVGGAPAAGTPSFDLIVSDMQMPVMDGYEFVRRLRAAGLVTPVLALTAHTMSGDEARALEAGCDRFAAKPIDRATFLGLCRELLGGVQPEYASD